MDTNKQTVRKLRVEISNEYSFSQNMYPVYTMKRLNEVKEKFRIIDIAP